MTLEDIVTLWLGSFALVFLAAFQSRAVNTERMPIAMCNSFCLAGANIIAVRGMVNGTPWICWMVTGTAGSAAIMGAMLFARLVFGRRT